MALELISLIWLGLTKGNAEETSLRDNNESLDKSITAFCENAGLIIAKVSMVPAKQIKNFFLITVYLVE